MNRLEEFFYKNTENRINKWLHYFEIYDRYFSRFRGAKINMLEIGVQHGGSLNMWRDYFGPQANIFGMDVNPNCKILEENGFKIFIGSQESRSDLRNIRRQLPELDILIDDGGHTMKQQKYTFEEMFGAVKNGGLYIAEDLHTSYWKKFGGGYKKKRSFIEYSKNFIDRINAWHSKKLLPDELTENIYGLHFYSSVLVIEKRKMEKPQSKMTGVEIVRE